MPQIGPLGVVEIIIILVVILIIFGPKNLPKLGSAVGKAVKNLREGLGGNKKIAEKDEAQAQSTSATQQAQQAANTQASSSDAASQEDEAPELEVVDKPEPGRKQAEGEKAE